MFAAITAASEGYRTAVIEPNEKVGRKLAITGKGRCNVTNNCDADTVMKNVPRNPRFLYSALSMLSPADVMDFFEKEGVPLKTERGNRVFPVSDKAYDIVDALFFRMKREGVSLIRAKAKEITAEDGFVTGVKTDIQLLDEQRKMVEYIKKTDCDYIINKYRDASKPLYYFRFWFIRFYSYYGWQ